MSFDTPTPSAEREPRFPTLDEIAAKLKELCGHENPTVVRTIEDEEGVALHEVVVTDQAGDDTLYVYRRAGEKSATTDITTACFMGKLEDDVCVGGENLSTYDETTGQWTDAGIAKKIEMPMVPTATETTPAQPLVTDPVIIIDETNAQEVFNELLRKEVYTALQKQFDEAEALYSTVSPEETNLEVAKEARDKAKPLLNKIYARLVALNKSESENNMSFTWNPGGDLTKEQFDELNLRRMKLSNAVGILHKDASGKIAIRHDLNEI